MIESDVSTVIPHAVGDRRNLQIQWLRAVAAIMVMLFHASVYGVVLLKNDSALNILDGRLGISGVSLFFAISGYLMATAIRVQEPFTFLAHRVIRIYPAMLIAASLYCVMEHVLHQPMRVGFAQLMLAPIGNSSKYPLRVEWTLVFEVTFYIALFFIAVLGQAKHLKWIALCWLTLLAGLGLYGFDRGATLYPIQTILTACETVGMAGGLLIPSLLKLRLPPLLLLVAGATAWPIYTLHPMGNEGARWLFGIGATLIVAGAIGLSSRWPAFGYNRLGRTLANFGDHSYALYLVHVPIIYTVYSVMKGVPFPFVWLIAVALTIFVALLFGQLDVALYRRLKSWLKSVPQNRIRWTLCLYLVVFFALAVGPSWKEHVIEHRTNMANALAAKLGRINTVDQAKEVALAAGFTPSADLQGVINAAAASDNGLLSINGWAVDARQHKGGALLALFQNGALLQAGTTWFSRPAIQARFTTKAKAGFGFDLAQPCTPSPVIGIILTPDRRFAVMPQAVTPDCTRQEVNP